MKKIKTISLSTFEEWNATHYLNDYYMDVEADEKAALKFQSEFFRSTTFRSPMLEFGTGPTVFRSILASSYISEINMADFLPSNLDAIREWLNKGKKSHNWNNLTRYILRCEGNNKPSREDIQVREDNTRKKITKLLIGDAYLKDPLGKQYRGHYPLVVSGFCADSATKDKKTWSLFMRNIASLVAPEGYFFTAALKNAKYYKVGNKYFPSANIDEDDLYEILKLDFHPKSINIKVRSVSEHSYQGYDAIFLAYALKRK